MSFDVNEPKHTLTVLRRLIGLKQSAMALTIGCSLPTVQAVEYGKLKLSEKLAQKVVLKTGVNLEWLLKNDATQPIIAFGGEPYTREHFERTQAGSNSEDQNYRRSAFVYLILMARMAGVILAAHNKGDAQLALFKLNSAIHEIGEGFRGGEDWEVACMDYLKENYAAKPVSELARFIAYGFAHELKGIHKKKTSVEKFNQRRPGVTSRSAQSQTTLSRPAPSPARGNSS